MSTKIAQHTPPPYKVFGPDYKNEIHIGTLDGEGIATLAERAKIDGMGPMVRDERAMLANAEFLCRAATSHGALVEATKMALGWLIAEQHQVEQGRYQPPRLDAILATIADLEKALAAAEVA